jgi:hypothetical protein
MKPTNFLSLLTGSFASPTAENPAVAMIEEGYRHANYWRRLTMATAPISPASPAPVEHGPPRLKALASVHPNIMRSSLIHRFFGLLFIVTYFRPRQLDV